jgi:hypothetical protein
MALRRVTLADLAPGRSNVSRIIMEGARAEADAAQRGGEGWASGLANVSQQLSGALQASAAESRQRNVQDAVSLATRNRYPSATKPVAGSAADVADPGSDHMAAILDRLSPEDRPLAIKGIREIQSYGAEVQQHNLQIKKLQGDLSDAEAKRQTIAADYGAGLGKQISQWLPKADGGLSAATFAFGHAQAIGTKGIEEFEPVLQGLSQEWAAAQASGDPGAIQAAAEKNRATIGPLAQKLQMGGSPEWQEKNQRKGIAQAEGTAIVDPVSGTVISPASPRRETRSVDEQIAAATLAGDDATVQKLLQVKRQAASAARDPEAAAARVAARGDARLDKSYQFNSAELERTAKPLTDQAERFGRLVETVNQKTPQADALIAPELLTVMAGGSGSGLRMNEAEISRVIGGRSKMEGLKAALNKWSLDPSKALSVTDEQRKEIGLLLAAMRDRISAKSTALDDARNGLVDATTVEEHRRVMAALKKKLTEAGASTGAPAGRKNPFR